jgi:hypothetical protein
MELEALARNLYQKMLRGTIRRLGVLHLHLHFVCIFAIAQQFAHLALW